MQGLQRRLRACLEPGQALHAVLNRAGLDALRLRLEELAAADLEQDESAAPLIQKLWGMWASRPSAFC